MTWPRSSGHGTTSLSSSGRSRRRKVGGQPPGCGSRASTGGRGHPTCGRGPFPSRGHGISTDRPTTASVAALEQGDGQSHRCCGQGAGPRRPGAPTARAIVTADLGRQHTLPLEDGRVAGPTTDSPSGPSIRRRPLRPRAVTVGGESGPENRTATPPMQPRPPSAPETRRPAPRPTRGGPRPCLEREGHGRGTRGAAPRPPTHTRCGHRVSTIGRSNPTLRSLVVPPARGHRAWAAQPEVGGRPAVPPAIVGCPPSRGHSTGGPPPT